MVQAGQRQEKAGGDQCEAEPRTEEFLDKLLGLVFCKLSILAVSKLLMLLETEAGESINKLLPRSAQSQAPAGLRFP